MFSDSESEEFIKTCNGCGKKVDVTVKILDKHYCTVIDTGSPISILKTSVVNDENLNKLKSFSSNPYCFVSCFGSNKIKLDGISKMLKDRGILKTLHSIPEITKAFHKSKFNTNMPLLSFELIPLAMYSYIADILLANLKLFHIGTRSLKSQSNM